MAEGSIEARPLTVDGDNLGFFRWARLGDQVVVTNDAGDWTILSEDHLAQLLSGEIGNGHARFDEFRSKGLLRDGLDLDTFANKMAQRSRHVRRGAFVHVVTLNSETPDGNMDQATAERIAHFALDSMSPAISIEIQGANGEPLENFAALRHLVEVAEDKNTQTSGKKLTFRVQTNLTAMNDEIADWLIDHDVLVGTRLDGPATIHDANREHLGGSTHSDTVRWIEHFHKRYSDAQRDPKQWFVEGRAAVTRSAFEAPGEIVGEYIRRGIPTVQLQPLSASRFASDTWQAIGYDASEYANFYDEFFSAVIDANKKGNEVADGLATVFAIKILTEEDPGIVDIQSPYGAGTGQLAYDSQGRVFPCEEARASDDGEGTFLLGNVADLAIGAIAEHPTVRAIAAASLLDAQPLCADCFNKPYCGFSPVRNFFTQGDLFGRRTRCFECREHMAAARCVFSALASGDEATEILRRWTVTRSPHLLDTRASKEAL